MQSNLKIAYLSHLKDSVSNYEFWIIDYRIFDPNKDWKSKLDHMEDMLGLIDHRKVLYKTCLMDTWYATAEKMMWLHKKWDKFNHIPVDQLEWSLYGSNYTKLPKNS